MRRQRYDITALKLWCHLTLLAMIDREHHRTQYNYFSLLNVSFKKFQSKNLTNMLMITILLPFLAHDFLKIE